MTYFVYILRTSANTLYVGQTNNLKRRIKEHRAHKSRSARYLRSFSSFELVYSEEYESRREAMRREAQLKKMPKTVKEAIVSKVMLS